MLGAGHVAQYLFKWRNLCQHSQQGWEILNWLIKTVYFRRTNRGGATNRGKGNQSRLLPIGQFLQRHMMWATGLEGKDIEAWKKRQAAATQEGLEHGPTTCDNSTLDI